VLLLSASSWWLAGRSLRPVQQSWERQQTFVANASHELRTPLTLMRASAEVALRGLPHQDADRRELLGDVLHETDHMSKLVEELLLLSRLDAGRLNVDRQPIAVPDLLADVQRQIGRLADERGVRLCAGALSGVVLADPTHLRQVLLIVLDNALRHTPKGGQVQIESQARGRQIAIVVGDTGAGIAPAHLPHVFERFYRADSARGSNGSGLGLSIAKGLIEAQHGQIMIASEQGKGTQVTIMLPHSAEAL
jgi:signal transduction histidine kinase